MIQSQVLFLSDESPTLVPALKQLFDECEDAKSNSIKLRFVSPQDVYKSDFEEADFIVMDYAFHQKHPETTRAAFQYPQKLSLFATLTDHQQMNDILKSTKTSHLFGMSGTHTLNDMKSYLLSSIKKKFWTPDTFVSAPAKHSKTQFTCSEHLDEQIEKALETHDFSHTFEGFKTIMIQILNEALTNALFNAPVDGDGNFTHRHQNRREKIMTESGKEPVLEVAEDEEKIVFSVKDFYGTLTKEVIDHYLTHGEIANKDGGAGVGIYLILKHAHKVVINIAPGKMTEFIVVLHKFKRFFHYQTLEKSYHLFIFEPKL